MRDLTLSSKFHNRTGAAHLPQIIVVLIESGLFDLGEAGEGVR